MHQLFYRTKFTAYQCGSRLGKTLEAKHASYAWPIAVAILVAIAIIIFLWLGEYTRKKHIEKSLAFEEGLSKAYTLQVHTLIGREVQEGLIKKDKPLCVLSIEHSLLELTSSQAPAIKKLKKRSVTSQVKVFGSMPKKSIHYE